MMSTDLVTFIARLTDSMLLVATMDNGPEIREYQLHAKRLLKTLKQSSPSRCTFNAGQYYFHYVIEAGVVYLTLAEKGYPKRLAFQYLTELHREFDRIHGHEVSTFCRPYAAVEFDPIMNRLRKDYIDPHTPGNVSRLNSDLNEIHNYMCQNLNDVLARGDKLEHVQNRSERLLLASKDFKKQSKYANLRALWRNIAPLIVVAFIIILVLYLRFFR